MLCVIPVNGPEWMVRADLRRYGRDDLVRNSMQSVLICYKGQRIKLANSDNRCYIVRSCTARLRWLSAYIGHTYGLSCVETVLCCSQYLRVLTQSSAVCYGQDNNLMSTFRSM